MGELDPASIETLRMLGAAVFGAVAGGTVGEWRARAAEGGAEARERRRLEQDVTLRMIAETQRDHIARPNWLIRWLAGDSEGIREIKYGQEAYPDANMYLLGDESLIRQVLDISRELHQERPFGSGLGEGDAARLGALLGHVSARLAAQRERVMRGEPPLWPSNGFVQSVLEKASDRFGIPKEMQPPMRADDPSRGKLRT